MPSPLTNLTWQAAYGALTWLRGLATPASSAQPLSLANYGILVLGTLQSGLAVMDIQATTNGMSTDLPLLRTVASLPIRYSPEQSLVLNNRIAALSNGIPTFIAALPGTWPVPSVALGNGDPAIQPSADLLTTLLQFQGESPPAGYDGTFGSLQSSAAIVSGAWAGLVSVVSGYYNTNPPGGPLDSVIRAAAGASLATDILGSMVDYPSPATLPPAMTWNQAFATPAMLSSSRLSSPDISTVGGQEAMATRAFLASMSNQVAIFTVMMEGLAGSGRIATTVPANQGQGLMDIASAQLGNFESWKGLTTGIPAPWGAGALSVGQQVQLVPGTPGLPVNPLGTDIDLGQQDRPMPPWTGDFNITTGVQNYQAALGRRLSTTLGALIYHPLYGSRIPPELGQILTVGGAALISAFGRSALAADPRTRSILAASASSVSGQPDAIAFSGTVLPIGPLSVPTGIGQVIAGGGALV